MHRKTKEKWAWRKMNLIRPGPAENLRDEAAEMVDENEQSKDPMSPENIKDHEPTAVDRNEDTNITEEGQAGTNTEEDREKSKKGMTEV